MIEAGTICRKISGREAGRYCIVVSIDEKGGFAQVSGVAKFGMCKPRRCNVKHLVATQFRIPLKSTKQEDIERSISESGVITKMGLKKDKRLKYIRIIKGWGKAGKKKVEKKEVKKEAPKKEAKKELPKKTEKPEKVAKPEKKARPKKATESKK